MTSATLFSYLNLSQCRWNFLLFPAPKTHNRYFHQYLKCICEGPAAFLKTQQPWETQGNMPSCNLRFRPNEFSSGSPERWFCMEGGERKSLLGLWLGKEEKAKENKKMWGGGEGL